MYFPLIITLGKLSTFLHKLLYCVNIVLIQRIKRNDIPVDGNSNFLFLRSITRLEWIQWRNK